MKPQLWPMKLPLGRAMSRCSSFEGIDNCFHSYDLFCLCSLLVLVLVCWFSVFKRFRDSSLSAQFGFSGVCVTGDTVKIILINCQCVWGLMWELGQLVELGQSSDGSEHEQTRLQGLGEAAEDPQVLFLSGYFPFSLIHPHPHRSPLLDVYKWEFQG